MKFDPTVRFQIFAPAEFRGEYTEPERTWPHPTSPHLRVGEPRANAMVRAVERVTFREIVACDPDESFGQWGVTEDGIQYLRLRPEDGTQFLCALEPLHDLAQRMGRVRLHEDGDDDAQ